MLNGVIFSKDRACQLDLLLRSIEDNFKEYPPVTILYMATTSSHEEGYKKVIGMHPKYDWRKEVHFYNDTQEIFKGFKNEFMVNFVDDEIVIRNTPINPVLDILRRPDVHCASLRLAPHINYCYTADSQDPPPSFEILKREDQLFYLWNWRESWRDASNWHYPSCINSHIYKVEDFKRVVSMFHYPCPNPLEGYFNNHRQYFKPLNVCFEKSKTINVANNLVQTGRNRFSEKPEFHQETLNKKFLEGQRLDPKPFYNFDNVWATFPKDYSWEN